MNNVTITNQTLIVEPIGLDKMWSFTARLVVPLSYVVGATLEPVDTLRQKRGMRMPGLAVFHKWAGTFILKGKKSFWNVSDAGSVVSIQLRDAKYDQLFVSVKNPKSVVDDINARVVR